MTNVKLQGHLEMARFYLSTIENPRPKLAGQLDDIIRWTFNAEKDDIATVATSRSVGGDVIMARLYLRDALRGTSSEGVVDSLLRAYDELHSAQLIVRGEMN